MASETDMVVSRLQVLARTCFLADMPLQYCKPANASRTAFQIYYWYHLQASYSLRALVSKSVRNQTILRSHVAPISKYMALVKTNLKYDNLWLFQSKRFPTSALEIPYYISTLKNFVSN